MILNQLQIIKRMLIKSVISFPINALFVVIALAIGEIDWAFICGMASAMSMFAVNTLVDKYYPNQQVVDDGKWIMLMQEPCEPQTIQEWEHHYGKWEN